MLVLISPATPLLFFCTKSRGKASPPSRLGCCRNQFVVCCKVIYPMNRTKIEYLNFTWNPIAGCSGIGCAVRKECWARAQSKRRKWRCTLCYVFKPHLHKERLHEPLQRKKSSRIGVTFSGDFFDIGMHPNWQ